MTLYDWLVKFASAAPNLVQVLTQAGEKVPDLKPQTDAWIAQLQAAVSPANLAQVGIAITRELGDVAQGRFKPRSHPGDSA